MKWRLLFKVVTARWRHTGRGRMGVPRRKTVRRGICADFHCIRIPCSQQIDHFYLRPRKLLSPRNHSILFTLSLCWIYIIDLP